MRKHLFVAIASLALPATAFAQDSASSAGWKGQGELGLAINKGNSDTQSFVGKLNASHEGEIWKHSAGASFIYGKTDDVESAYRYELFGTTGRRLSENTYLVGSLRNERDHFTTYDYQWIGAVGLGWEALKRDATKLTFEVGPGYRVGKLREGGDKDKETIVRGWMDFSHQLTATTSLYDTLLIESGGDNTFAKNDLGLQVQMSDALALKAGLQTRYNSDVQPGVKKTDQLTTVNVVYGF